MIAEGEPISRRQVLGGLAAGAVMGLASRAVHGQAGGTMKHARRRVFITGATQGLGLGAATALMREGHEVVLHARSAASAEAIADLTRQAAGLVIGDFTVAAQTRSVADQVNKIGRMDAVIHNAGTYGGANRVSTSEGRAQTLAVNTLAPYMLTGLIERPGRLIYISSSMHRGAGTSLDDIDWFQRPWAQDSAYSESKLYVTTLAMVVARRWSNVFSNAVDPGWVPTSMGGPNAPDDLEMGHQTQVWLAVSDDTTARVSGGYWHHKVQQSPARQTRDPGFQDRLMASLRELTGVTLFRS